MAIKILGWRIAKKGEEEEGGVRPRPTFHNLKKEMRLSFVLFMIKEKRGDLDF